MADDPIAMKQFLDGDVRLFQSTQFQQLGGLDSLVNFKERDKAFDALRQSSLVRQSITTES